MPDSHLPTLSDVEISTPAAWWGELTVHDGQATRWRLGPLNLKVRHQGCEWWFSSRYDEDSFADSLAINRPRPEELEADDRDLVRIVSCQVPDTLTFAPAPADRPVVARPETVFRLLPGARVGFFVSLPVWLQVRAGQPPVTLLDLPTWRLTDTWFGPTNQQGELAYAVRTKARLDLDSLPLRPHRAVVKVQVHNRATDTLNLEQINLPVPHLSLFADADDHLWTQSVTVERQNDGALAEVRIDKGPPDEARSPTQVAEPRTVGQRSLLIRALHGWLG